MRYYLGIDQGGTKTAAAVCDMHGNILGAGEGGGACHQINGMDYAMARVLEAVHAALAPGKISLFEIAAIGGGLTGIDWAYEEKLVTDALVKATGVALIKAKNDVFGAFRAGTESGYGACVCSGTATNICAVAPDGREHSFNFYCRTGHPGKMGLEAVFDSECGIRPGTALTALALAHFGCGDVDSLMMQRVSGAIPTAAVKRFAPAVLLAAAQGDPVARDCVSVYGQDCAAYVVAGLRRFGMLNLPVEVVLSGSVFKTQCPPLLDAMEGKIRKHAPYIQMVDSVLEPVIGGLLTAMELDGIDVCDLAIQERLRISSQRWRLTRREAMQA